MAALTDFLKGKVKNVFGLQCVKAFKQVISSLCCAPILSASRHLYCIVRGCWSRTVGAVLMREDDMGIQKAIIFFFFKLQSVELLSDQERSRNPGFDDAPETF